MQLQFYNTMSRRKETIVQPEGRPLGIYACGITAYNYAHLGNLRRYVFDDSLLRVLRYDGYQVKHVQNALRKTKQKTVSIHVSADSKNIVI